MCVNVHKRVLKLGWGGGAGLKVLCVCVGGGGGVGGIDSKKYYNNGGGGFLYSSWYIRVCVWGGGARVIWYGHGTAFFQ